LAGIGKLPLPIMHRSIIISMERSRETLTRFDPKSIPDQRLDCEISSQETLKWARRVDLNLDPPMPEELRNRPADNWRVLVSIADARSPEWGMAAREAAIALSKGQDEDAGVLLLSDIRDIFDRRAADRLPSAVIVANLIDMPDALWSEWRGSRGDQSPRRLSQAQLATLLAAFSIRPRTIWPLRRGPTAKSSKGYFRKQFEAAWASYCDGTPAQRSNVRPLNPRIAQS
jgi:hypothetical protein